MTDFLLGLVAGNTLMINIGIWYLVGSRHAEVKNR